MQKRIVSACSVRLAHRRYLPAGWDRQLAGLVRLRGVEPERLIGSRLEGGGFVGNLGANTGSRSVSQVAAGSNLAKNGMPTRRGLRAWIIRSTKTLMPATSVTPSTHTLPGVADMDGPRTVRHRPEVPW